MKHERTIPRTQGATPGSKQGATRQPPDETEWNFSKVRVSDEEIGLCFLYEYGREQAKASPQWRRLVGEWQKKWCVETISSIFGGVNLHWFYHPDFVKTPWQRQDKTLRQKEAKRFVRDAAGAHTFQEFICLNITLQRDLHENAAAGVTDFDSWALQDKCFHREADQREQGFFAINWNFTNGQLAEEFGKWLKDKRGDRKAVESEQGTNKMRQHLKALGAKRLLDAGLTVEQAMMHTTAYLKDSMPLYDSPKAWSQAKNQTVPAVLKSLFSAKG